MFNMIKDTVEKIIKSNISISFAESATGGSLASTFTKIPGASNVFKGSFVTYSDEYKIKYLGVKKDTIDKYGVVSKEVALEMVVGLKKETNADICASVTGNAGPSKGDPNEPVGRVYVGLIVKDDKNVFELNLTGTREDIIYSTVEFVYNKINEKLADE